MKVVSIQAAGVPIVECVDAIASVDDALGLISACIERDSQRLLIDARCLPEAFFDLRSRFAGELIQKFENYRLRLAVVFAPDTKRSERFEQFLAEARRGRGFRAFTAREDAEAWLSAPS